MQSASVAYGTVASSLTQQTVERVTIGFPAAVPAAYQDASLTVLSRRVDRSLSSAMPEGTRLVAGYPSAQLTLQLGGLVNRLDESKTIAWLMGRGSATSPLYRTDCLGLTVTVDLGLLTADATATTAGYEGVEFVRVFTGVIDDYTVNYEAGTVDVTCLDYRAKLAVAPALPPAVAYNPYDYSTVVNPGLTAVYPLASLLRAGGLYVTPAPRSNLLLYASLGGSTWPEITAPATNVTAAQGYLRIFGPFVSNPGKFCPQVANQANVNVTLVTPLQLRSGVGTSVFFQWWQGPESALNYGAHSDLLNAASYGLTFDTRADAGGATATPRMQLGRNSIVTTVTSTASATANQWNYFAAQVTFPSLTQMTVKFWINGTTNTVTGAIPTETGDMTAAYLAAYTFGASEAVQITTETAPVSDYAFTPTAVLDSSLNALTALPDVTGQDSWGAIQDLAEAEQGIAGFDESGMFRFTNRATLAATAATPATLDASVNLGGLQEGSSGAAFRNRVQVPVTQLRVGTLNWVWSAANQQTPVSIPAKGSLSMILETTDPVINVKFSTLRGQPGINPDGNSYYRGCTAFDGQGAEVSSGLRIVSTQIDPKHIRVDLSSTRGTTTYLVTPIGAGYPVGSEGQPALWIGGQFVTANGMSGDTTGTTSSGVVAESQYPPLVPDGGAATSPRGEKILALTDNPWRQDLSSAQALADALLQDLAVPKPMLSGVKVRADARRQIGDRVTINDPDGCGYVGETAVIVGVTSSGEDWTADLELRLTGKPGGWLLGVSGRTELGSTTYI